MKKAIVVLLAGWLLSTLAQAEIFSIVYTNEGLHGLKATDKASGRALWQSQLKMKKIRNEQGEIFLYAEETGSGIWGKEKKDQTWRSDAYFYFKDNTITPYQVKQTYKDRAGQVSRTELALQQSDVD